MGQELDLTEQLYVHATQGKNALERLEDLRLWAVEPQNEESACKLREEIVRQDALLMQHRIAMALLRSRLSGTDPSMRGRQDSVDLGLRWAWLRVIGGKRFK